MSLKKHPPEVYELLEWLVLQTPGTLELRKGIPEHLRFWWAYCEVEHLVVPTGDRISQFGRLALQQRDAPQVEVEGKPPAIPTGASDVSLDEQALAIFFAHRDWPKKKIAKHLGCHEKSLAPSRCPKLDAAIKAWHTPNEPSRKVRRGSKDGEGNLEAWDEG